VAFVVAVALLAAAAWPFGLGAQVRRLQRGFAAAGYLRAAETAAQAVPVRREAALHALNRAVALAPQDSIVTRRAAQLYVELRAYAEGAEWLSRRQPPAVAAPAGAPLDPEQLLTRVSLAQCLLMTGRATEGEHELQQVEAEVYAARERNAVPDGLFALMLNNLAYVEALGRVNLLDALKMATVAAQLEPTQAAYLDSLGWVEYQMGEHRKGAFHIEQAVRLHLPRESAEMYYHLGAAYARLGKKAEARWALNRSLELDPSFVEAADELKVLGQDLPRPAIV